jgi:DNA polymerase III subunit beta
MTGAAVATKPRAPAKPKPEPAPGMKLTLNRGDVLKALGHASAIVEARNTIPVLANVLLEAQGDALRIVSTDLNMQISLTVPARVDGDGATTVSAKLLHDIIRAFSDGSQVELRLDGDRLHVVSGRSRYKLATIKREDFPVLKPTDPVATFSLPPLDLLKAIRSVEFAQNRDDVVRPYLCGINLDVEDGELCFAATDGVCLAVAKMPAPEGATFGAGIILPTKFLASLVKLIDGFEGDVRLIVEERKVTAELGDTTLVSKLVEGAYPPWRRVLPANAEKKLVIDAESFETAVRRTSLVTMERTRAVKLELTSDKLTVSAFSPDHGSAVEEAPCSWSDGEFVIGFNSRIILDMLRAAGAKTIQVDIVDVTSPPLFSNPDDDSAKWIVPPMRV